MFLNGLPSADEIEEVRECSTGRDGDPDCVQCHAENRWRYLLCDAVASGAFEYYVDGHIENVTRTKRGMAFLKEQVCFPGKENE